MGGFRSIEVLPHVYLPPVGERDHDAPIVVAHKESARREDIVKDTRASRSPLYNHASQSRNQPSAFLRDNELSGTAAVRVALHVFGIPRADALMMGESNRTRSRTFDATERRRRRKRATKKVSGTFSRAQAPFLGPGFIDTKSDEILPVLEKWKWLVAQTCD